eukprot:g14793.t1
MESFRDATLAEASRHDLRLTGMFTPQQLEIMKRLGIRTYLSSDACIFRTIFEDRALWNWFHSPRVRIHNPTGRMGFTWMANMTDYSQRIFHRVDQELAEEFITDEGLFMKFTGDMRKGMFGADGQLTAPGGLVRPMMVPGALGALNPLVLPPMMQAFPTGLPPMAPEGALRGTVQALPALRPVPDFASNLVSALRSHVPAVSQAAPADGLQSQLLASLTKHTPTDLGTSNETPRGPQRFRVAVWGRTLADVPLTCGMAHNEDGAWAADCLLCGTGAWPRRTGA